MNKAIDATIQSRERHVAGAASFKSQPCPCEGRGQKNTVTPN
jgi:hypothetical protein